MTSLTMNTSTATRLLSFVALATIATLQSAASYAAPHNGVPIFSDRAPARQAESPPAAKGQSAFIGTLSASALSASALDVTFPDGSTVTARLQRVVRDDNKGTQSWVGTFDDAPNSALVLSKVKGVVTGFAIYKDTTLEILPSKGGKHVLYTVDDSKLPKGELVLKPKLRDVSGGVTVADSTASATVADAIVQDVLILYTPTSAARYGQASIESQIQSAVQSANQAYINSGANISLNVVGLTQSSFAEQGGQDGTLAKLQSDAGVANLRNSLGADMVMIVSEDSDYCGTSNLMMSNSTSYASSAFAVVYSGCLSNQSLAHEFGHQQGLMHDRDSSGGYTGAYPYGFGYRRCVSDGTGFRDIMSYSCTGAPRVLIFSSPYATYNGYPAGIAYESSPSTSAENVRAMNNTAATVAAYRASKTVTPTAPAAPSGLATSSVAYNRVSLLWTDNSSNETGFKVERSGDGVNFTEIATLGAEATSFADSAVSARTNYYYRVRAYNGYGASGYSAVVGVTTPDVPPPPPAAPSSIAATDQANGSSAVAWAAASGADKYEVRRETYNSSNGTWGSSTSVATVSSSFTSIVDTSGSGTFRYTVRATNAGGASAYAGPAQVTVTGGPAKKGKGRNR